MQLFLESVDYVFGLFVGVLYPILFFDISFGYLSAPLPLIVITLLLGALIFTFYFKFINIRGFKHSIDIIKGKYDNPEDTGQISHFQDYHISP
jgi:AGCS family alanine or glycine:cation symporter